MGPRARRTVLLTGVAVLGTLALVGVLVATAALCTELVRVRPAPVPPPDVADLAARGNEVVGVGTAGGRPVVVVSVDGGRRWQRTAPPTPPVTATGPNEPAPPVSTAPPPRRITVRPGGGWVAASGESDRRGPTVWTSPDGLGWAAQAVDPGAFRDGDSLDDLTATPTSLVLAGYAGDGGMRPVVWTSPDALTWHRHELAPSTTTPSWVSSVVAHEEVVLACGYVRPDARSRPACWRSPDGGGTWSGAPVPPGGDAAATVATPSGLTSIGTDAERMWATRSTDGTAWTPLATAPAVPGFDTLAHAEAVASSGDELAVVTRSWSPGPPRLAVRHSPDGRSWSGGGSEQLLRLDLRTVAVTGDRTVVVGRSVEGLELWSVPAQGGSPLRAASPL